MRFTLAGLAAVVFAVGATATAPPAAASPEEEFLDALAASGLSFPPAATANVLSGGRGVCRDWASGSSYADVVAGVAGAMGGNQRLAGVFVNAATSAFCPKYMSEIR